MGDDDLIIDLQDDVSTWKPGDRIFITSTDYDMLQAEEFSLMNCPQCKDTEIRIQGKHTINIVIHLRSQTRHLACLQTPCFSSPK